MSPVSTLERVKTPKKTSKVRPAIKIGSRVPPHDLSAEASTLGAILIDAEAIIKVADFLKAGDFYDGKHQLIYESMIELWSKHSPIDLLTVVSTLRDKKHLKTVGGETYIAELTGLVPSSRNVIQYGKIVKHKATLRNLVIGGGEISTLGYTEDEDLGSVLEEAEKTLFAVTQAHIQKAFTHIKDIVPDTYQQISDLQQNEGELRGLSTGYNRLDNMLSGLQDGDLVILAARPSMGKTTLAMNMAEHASIVEGKSVAIFSLEMGKEQLVERMFCSLLQVNSHDLRSGKLSADDFGRMGTVIDQLSKSNIWIDDQSDIESIDIRAKARRLQMEHGLDLIIVDYLQLIRGNTPSNRVLEISEISRSLKSLARELNVPVIALSQLSRGVESRSDKMPQLHDLRDSGSIEQDADVVMMMYREGYYDDSGEEDNGTTDVLIRKHRNGPTGNTKLHFDKAQLKFRDFTDREYEELSDD